jgi:hypothetical protein
LIGKMLITHPNSTPQRHSWKCLVIGQAGEPARLYAASYQPTATRPRFLRALEAARPRRVMSPANSALASHPTPGAISSLYRADSGSHSEARPRHETTINSGDLAGMQALEKRTAELKQKQAQIALLESRLEALEQQKNQSIQIAAEVMP